MGHKMDKSGLRVMVQDKVFKVLSALSGFEFGGASAYGVNTELAALGLDSLKLVEVVFELEVEYGVDADESTLSRLKTVGDLIDMFCIAVAGSGIDRAC
jgi:acyl carrier protein